MPAQLSSGPFCVGIAMRILLEAAGYRRERQYKASFSYGRKACCVPIIVLLVIAALGPKK
jgi:hypothetical protein